ncbi:MAG: translation initiation factor IF-5A [Euryarchaeota archaeon CG01_land_8_20_14_3_00_38_12]|nr:MAG: translation initiation factor IF-5A [Euryarchaeota archaeon CG01_land_8_20_14_3_00_38_12]
MAEVRTLKVGKYIIVDDEPCKILSITTSKPGKHGEAKARIDAMGLFDTQKRSIVHPVKHKVGVPMIDKRTAQVLSVAGSTAQLMDMATYETFELPLPENMTLEPGKEIQYMEALGRRKITRA